MAAAHGALAIGMKNHALHGRSSLGDRALTSAR
jgi:hypothetical protein